MKRPNFEKALKVINKQNALSLKQKELENYTKAISYPKSKDSYEIRIGSIKIEVSKNNLMSMINDEINTLSVKISELEKEFEAI